MAARSPGRTRCILRAVELRDVVETLVGLDDERRALTSEVQRALDALERSLLPPERFGIEARKLVTLRERIGMGSQEASALDSLGASLRDRLVEDARIESETLVRLTSSGRSPDNRLGTLPARWGSLLDRGRAAWESLGALGALLQRRTDVEARLAKLRKSLGRDELAAELLELVLAARVSVGPEGTQASRLLLEEAESDAARDGSLAALAANLRAVRDAISAGRHAQPAAADLVRHSVDLGLGLSHERDELRRELATLSREVERRQEMSHALFQAVTKASEVLEAASRLESLSAGRLLADGALGPLKAACIEHGIITVLLGLREVELDRRDLDQATSDLSAALGELLSRLEDRPDLVARLVPAWDDLAAVDSRTSPAELEAACWEATGLRKDARGVMSVAPDQLALLAAADRLDPWVTRIFQRIDSRTAEVHRATERLEALDATVASIAEAGSANPGVRDLAERAVSVRAALARFVGEALHVLDACSSAVRHRLTAEATGFEQIHRRTAPFAHLEEAHDENGRHAALQQTLSEVRELFTQLEAHALGEGTVRSAEWRQEEDRVRTASRAAQERLAGILTRLRRLSALLLPPQSAMVEGALALAVALQRGEEPPPRDRLGEALEALHGEKLFLRLLDLPPGDEVRPLARLASERSARRLAVLEASLVLLFMLLGDLGDELEGLAGEAREAHLAWIRELVDHAHAEAEEHAQVLDEILFELEDNASRLARWSAAFDAYHRWASRCADAEVGMELSPAVFERFEQAFSRLGRRTLDGVRAEHADWRVSSSLESLMELHGLALSRLEGVSTLTDLRGSLGALRARAEELRDRILALAEKSADGRPSPGHLIFG